MSSPVKKTPRPPWQVLLVAGTSVLVGAWLPPAAGSQNAHTAADEHVRLAAVLDSSLTPR